jgi:hypothetical protein
MLFASVAMLGETLIAVDPVLVTLMTGVPVTAYPVPPEKTEPVLFTEIVLVPNAKVPVKDERLNV